MDRYVVITCSFGEMMAWYYDCADTLEAIELCKAEMGYSDTILTVARVTGEGLEIRKPGAF